MVPWSLVELDDVNSTQAAALALATKGAPEGTTVVAKAQTSGSGRLGRRWISPVGGLYMSFIIRPRSIPAPELASLVGAVAVVDGVKRTTGLTPSIRWPNDVMLGGRKLGGVIADAQASRQGVNVIVIGIGVNCNAAVSRIRGLKGQATSVSEEMGGPVAIPDLRNAILASFNVHYGQWKAGKDMHEIWKKHVGTQGRRVAVKMKTHETPFSGRTKGIRKDGALLVARGKGTIVLRAEDVEWLRELA